jgi:transcriptional regulator with XRE-family HTH domain
LRDVGEEKASSASLWSGKGFRGSLASATQESWVIAGAACFGKRIRPHDNQFVGAWTHEPNLKDHDPPVQIDSVDPDSARNTNRIVALLLAAMVWTFAGALRGRGSQVNSTYRVEYSKSYSTFADLQSVHLFSYFYLPMSLSISERFRIRLAMLRKLRGLTQQELEKRIGKSDKEAGYVSRLETGAIGTPPFEMIQTIADALQVDVGEFFFAEGLDESPEELMAAINAILPQGDPKELRKIYRLILVNQEKYSK